MKITFKYVMLILSLTFAFQGCDVKDDNEVPNDIAVNNFVWKGLNLYYLWQADVPDLSDSRFADQNQLNNFLYGFPNPQDLFQRLLNKPVSLYDEDQAIDRFSVLFDDYYELEGLLSGTTATTGIDFRLYYKDTSHTSIFGVIRYVLPNSDAAGKDIHRGDIFYAINGNTLTPANYQTLLKLSTSTFNLADYASGAIIPNGRSVELTQEVVSENPVYINTTFNEGSHKIGYLMYNGFYSNYENELNDAFGNLKAQGITDLVLDLRYNSGGSVETATRLASMITGQFNGQLFAKEQWNAKVEAYYNSHNPATLYNFFTNTINNGAPINSLNLSKVYVLTTDRTASASELVIKCLEPYIDVVQIGATTVGKNVGSITLYDSPTFTKRDISNKHRYAMQPLVLKIINKLGQGDYVHGLAPDTTLLENFGNMGVLGDRDEPLLHAAIMEISGGGRIVPQQTQQFNPVIDIRPVNRFKSEMYRNQLPDNFYNIQ